MGGGREREREKQQRVSSKRTWSPTECDCCQRCLVRNNNNNKPLSQIFGAGVKYAWYVDKIERASPGTMVRLAACILKDACLIHGNNLSIYIEL